MRIASASLIIAAVLVIAAFVAGQLALESSQALLPPRVLETTNRIALVKANGTISAIAIGNEDTWQISPTDGFFYTWPTWSPDASQLVFSGVSRNTPSEPQISLFAFDVASQTSREFYVDEPGAATLLANGVVHYPLWSPNSRHLAFIAGTDRGPALFVGDPSNEVAAQAVLHNGPLWMSWSPNSRQLLVHRRGNHYLVDVNGEADSDSLGISTGDYRVPAWKPDGTAITVVSDEGQSGGFELMEARVINGGFEDSQLEPKMITSESPAFLWSPDGEYLAIANGSRVLLYLNLNLLVYQDLRLVPSNSDAEAIEIPGNILAYFWSPDGTKLAYVTLSDTQRVLRWMIYDVEQDTEWPLVDFEPTVDQLTMFQFFDQYAYSHSLWSSDSNALVFAGTLSTEGITASTNQPLSNIIVVDVAPNSLPQILTEGNLAVWSPK